ncbi:MAG: metallopeptidase TldD-related protein [Polyangiaceae bacterium]
MKSVDLLLVCKEALTQAGEVDAEVFARVRQRGVARFAIGALGQHMDLEESEVVVRVARGKRIAEAKTSSHERSAIVEAVRRAAAIAKCSPETEGFAGFASKDDRREPVPRGDAIYSKERVSPPRRSEATVNTTAEGRVALLAPALSKIAARKLVSAGVLETSSGATVVATTGGCERAHDDSVASFRIWALETAGAGGAAGFGSSMHRDISRLEIEAETERAISRCELGKNPREQEAGTYDVVFEPPAVCELLEWLGMIAFSASEVEQGSSALAGRIGETITGENVSIAENPVDEGDLGFGAPFDCEGTLRRTIPIIERGIAKNVLTNRIYAARRGEQSTGSAVLPSLAGGSGISGVALQMEGGEAKSVDELISGVDRGLYVCRLHYVNGMLEPRRAVMTGLTRDGCFWIEKGKISHAVGNMRFTDSVLEGFSRIDAMTKSRKALPTWWNPGGATTAPAVRVRQFRFNGKSQTRPTM